MARAMDDLSGEHLPSDINSGSAPSTQFTAKAMGSAQTSLFAASCPHAPNPHQPWASQPNPAFNTSPLPFVTSSLPSRPTTAMTIRQRAQSTMDYLQSRLAKSSRLDMFMTMVRGKCPIEFAATGRLLAHVPFRGCDRASVLLPPVGWLKYKRLFKFEPYTYCYFCGLPQDRDQNGKAPDCHRSFRFIPGTICDFADFTYLTVWTLWHTEASRVAMLANFGLPPLMDYQDFARWAVTEEMMDGEYYKGLEVFIWYCERWLTSGRR